ncbi:MAG: PAS domain S-box protein [Burkholderiales bacterium]|nr:PAS domain S-box protein [Burkholderiales bacterium]
MRIALIAVAYLTTGWLGLKMPYVGTHITLLWLPTGISTAALLRWGRPILPGICLGALTVNLITGATLPLAIAISIGNTLAPSVTVAVLQHFGFRPEFERQKDVGLFLIAAGTGMAISATLGVLSLFVAGVLPLTELGAAWSAWWMGDTVGVLLGAPILLSLSRASLDSVRHFKLEIVLWLVAAVIVAWLAFLRDYEHLGRSLPLGFLPLPLLAWAALRFGNAGAAFAGLACSVVAAWGTATGHGTFSMPDADVSRFLLWCFMATAVLTGLLVAALQSERMQTERTLRASEEKLRGLYQLSPLGIALVDMQGRFLEFNEAFRAICGYSDAELKSVDYWALTPKEYEADEAVQLASLERTGRYGPYEKEYIRKDGKRVPVQLNGMLITGTDGKRYIWSIAEDISTRRENQQRMERLLNEQRAILENTLVGIVTIRRRTITWANPAFEKMLGYAAGELNGKSTRPNFTSDDDYHALGEIAYAVLSKGMPFRTQLPHRCKDGSTIWVDMAGAMLNQETGDSLWVFVDLTEQHRLRARVQQSEQQKELALAGADLGWWDISLPSGEMAHNPRLVSMLGYTPDDVVVHLNTLASLVHPQDIATLREAFIALLKSATDHFESEFRIRHQQGKWVWMSARGMVVERSPEGRALRIAGTGLDVTARKESEEALKARENYLSTLIASMQDLVFVLTPGGVIEECFVPRFPVRPLYRSRENVIGKAPADILPESVASEFERAMSSVHWNGEPYAFEFPLTIQGREYLSKATVSALLGEGEASSGFLAVIRDITPERSAQRERERLAQSNALLLNSVGDGIIGIDLDANLMFANPAAQSILGYTEDELRGTNYREKFTPHHEDGQPYSIGASIVSKTLADGQVRNDEDGWLIRKDGTLFPAAMTATPIIEGHTWNGVVVIFQDITERKANEARIRDMAFYDPLTRLPNRRLLLDRLSMAMLSSHRRQTYGAVIFLDLDKFKVLNDTKGHDYGDLLLIEVAQRLQTCVRSEDTVARMGGDEFVLVLENLGTDAATATAHASAIAAKVSHALSSEFLLNEYTHSGSSSLGIALFIGTDVSMEELIKRADLAMYQAKSAGPNTVRMFNAEAACL